MPDRVLYRFGAIVQAPAPDRFDVIRDAFLLQGDDGRIEAVGPWSDRAGGVGVDRVEEHADAVATPGFVDAHVHLAQLDVRGNEAEDLLPWLRDLVFPTETKLADPAVAREVSLRFFQALPELGTLAAGVYAPVQEEAARIAFTRGARSPLRLVMGKTMMDRNAPQELLDPSSEDSLRASEELAEEFHGANGNRLRYAFTPRFAPACSDRLLHLAAKGARRFGCGVQTHLSESTHEIDWVKRLHPDARDYLHVYERAGLVTDRSVLGHGVHVTRDEWQRLGAAGAWIAHCPGANAALNVGRFPWEAAPADAHVCMGTDVGAGPSLSMVDALAAARRAHGADVASPARLLHAATAAGARALGFAGDAGVLAAGADASFLLWDKPDGPVDGARFVHELLDAADARGREQVKPRRVIAVGTRVARRA